MDILLSVIIPTYNRASRLPVLIEALLQQTIDHSRSEIVIVDDGSRDSTWSVLQSYEQKQKDGWIRTLSQDNQGQAVARQYGVREARGRFLLFLDDDMEAAHPGFLQSHLAFHEREAAATVALGAILPPRDNPRRPAFEWFYEKSIRTMYESFQKGTLVPAGVHFFSANVSLPKDLFLKVGGFNAAFRQAEDRELGLRLQHEGGAKFAFVPEAAAFHNSPTGRFRSFMQRARLYGHYDLAIALHYPDQPELHPRQIFVSASRVKRLLARVAFQWPFLIQPLSWLVLPLAWGLPRRLAVPLCSVLYCLQYVRGYEASPLRVQDPSADPEAKNHAA
ncbi:exopolysaccharide biosynthesis glycosyltransferase EpsD [Oligoflexus tunisiensis]|uniref:exopolysaccharide biosynthesis glycosyltransferase EpsD n=1 Tax=Oligoflexus tunisiensis TaxID=708132 RepID=UPI00114D11FB|nr:exopolysaccharide biosynthesis glycosyltransferase EpsD [Oligoflexus tunisiensis]